MTFVFLDLPWESLLKQKGSSLSPSPSLVLVSLFCWLFCYLESEEIKLLSNSVAGGITEGMRPWASWVSQGSQYHLKYSSLLPSPELPLSGTEPLVMAPHNTFTMCWHVAWIPLPKIFTQFILVYYLQTTGAHLMLPSILRPFSCPCSHSVFQTFWHLYFNRSGLNVTPAQYIPSWSNQFMALAAPRYWAFGLVSSIKKAVNIFPASR